MAQTLVINRDALVARAALTGTALPTITITQLSALTISVAFATGTPLALAALPSGGTVRCVLKESPTSAVLLLDSSMPSSGSGADTVYSAVWDDADVDSTALRTFLAAATATENWTRTAFLEIEWTIDSSTERVFFPVTVRAAFFTPESTAPDPVSDAAWTWLKSRIVAGDNVTLTTDDSAKTITIAAEGGGASIPSNACTATVSSDGLFLEIRTFAGVLIGKCQAF